MKTRKFLAGAIVAASLASAGASLAPSTAVADTAKSSTAAGSVKWPAPLSGVTATPGPKVGEITFSWKTAGTNTTSFQVETGLTMFSSYAPAGLPRHGRGSKVFKVSKTKRSLTLSAAQVKAAGAGVATANHLYYHVFALNWTSKGAQIRQSAMGGVRPKVGAASTSGTAIRVASFNVVQANASEVNRTWLQRGRNVARTIIDANPGIAAIQELSPGRVDGKGGPRNGAPRQTDSLLSFLSGAGASKYRLVRLSPYAAAETKMGSQGERILYDSSRYTLLSNCPDESNGTYWSSSCTIQLPLNSGDSESYRRKAAYAEFQDKSTGKKFVFVSAHLEHRQSTNLATGKRLDNLRGRQASTITSFITKKFGSTIPVVIAGDFNSWQNNPAGNSPHDAVVKAGYYDTAAAATTTNLQYPTVNHFESAAASAQGYAARFDMIFNRGNKVAKTFSNVLKPAGADYASDHDLVYSDFTV